ncbi:DEAD/DEAH box helicase [Azospirillum doebereinerae]|uniref:Helicase SNF2 n=1 Tax=Azospirillum doebereinerae TaxID=92933 RepID=A0A3S0X9W1_9PROT|nr:DEAD/DEAH box helicase [Azospirillum doebereinerae]RUQ68428.1 helicase SNF2 [Azospirillum doebereinerae]
MTLLSSLRRHFDAGSYERGERYQRQGRVSALQADRLPDGTMRLAATVQGSQWIPYVQSVLLRVNANAVTMLDGECDCPVGINCKHVAAVAIAWASRPAEAGTASPKPAPAAPALSAPISDLLERLGEAAARDGGDSYPDTVRKRLLYVLRMEEGPNGREAAVCPLSVSLRKDDRFGSDDKPYATGWNQGQIPAKFVTPSDRAILQFMAQQLSHPSHPEKGRALRGEWAAGLVERMLRTGRLYWEDFRANPPLRPGPDRAGTARWTGDDKGRQRFDVGLDTPSAVVLPTVPLLYVDVESWECGSLTTEVAPHLAAALLGAPPLPPAEVAAFRNAAAVRFGARLPVLPEPPARTEARRVRPRPVLRLRCGRTPYSPFGYGGSMMAVPIPVGVLEFDYAGTRLAGKTTAPLQWMEDGTLVTAERIPADETKAAARLNGTGLIRNETPLSVAGGPPVRRELFVVPGDAFEESAGWLTVCHSVLPALRGEGWIVEIDPDFPYQLAEAPGNWSFEIGDGSGIDWFGLSLGVDVGRERVDLLPVLRSVIAALDAIDADAVSPDDAFFDIHDDFRDGNGASEEPRGLDAALDALAPDGILFVPVAGNRFLPLEAERLRPLLGVLMELFGLQTGDGAVRIGRTHLGDLAALEEAAEAAGVPLLGADAVRRMARTLREAGGVPAVSPPAGLRATLRPYQQAGLDWLQFLGAHEFGGILADDMGLGKTVQALAHLLAEKEAGRLDRPCLLVAPTSVLGNWRMEAKRFAPELRTLVLHGPQRKAAQGTLGDHDLVVTSYALLPRDRAILAAQPWHLAIFDEAQYLKNPTSQATKATHGLDARQRLCLSGTPVENNLDELWSLFSVAVPSLFGDRTGFRRQFRTPIEKHGDAERQRILARRVRPFLLRRTKEEVAGELPPKTEIRESVEPQAAQRDLYETIRLAMDQRVREEIARKGMARSHITILDALLKLRQACCDPRLVRLESARKRVAKGAASAKLDRLLEMLPDLLADGRRILLFSQFTSMLDLIKPELETLGIPFVELTGETRDRETPVRRFQAREVPLFLISLKAGGTGLNLTAADTVIHYDPWWNPAVEDQATDRAHRIGQDKPVFVYKLVTAGTVEERMLELQERKRRLGEAVYDQAATEADLLTAADIDFLLAPIDG